MKYPGDVNIHDFPVNNADHLYSGTYENIRGVLLDKIYICIPV